jgi:hypothetical protein
MTTAAPRIRPKLLRAIVRLDDRSVPIAEVNRRVGREAEQLGLMRPSYERVRQLVHLARRLEHRRRLRPVLQLVAAAGAGFVAGHASALGSSAGRSARGAAGIRPPT